MAFVGKPRKAQQQFETPEELYLRGSLGRTEDAVGSLWGHQTDAVRAYAEWYVDAPDVALELPTGTGKTLPGVLIAEWIRRKSEGPVIYATPTKQLARQVLATAQVEGVPARLLVGSHHSWEPADAVAVEGGSAIAITTYSSIFNSSPKLPVPRLVLLDDAHAGEQFVGEQYAITIRRHSDEAAYLSVLDALRPFLSGLQIQRLQGPPDPGVHHQVRLIVPSVKQDALASLDVALAGLGNGYQYAVSMIRSGLAACAVYLSYGGVQVRPMIPPTFENPVFSGAQQRVYLSATLGDGGELERAFGRPDIVRLPLPSKAQPRSGRRLFVFPDLVAGGDAAGLTRQIVAVTNKALVLSQASSSDAEQSARALAAKGVPVFGKAEVDQGLTAFKAAPEGVLGLANRYDGMDLPGSACRIVVLDGKPDAMSLQERFLSERADAHAALAERTRTRIVQGAGRCTRGPSDYAVVVVRGSDITRYFARPENIAALAPELQAEVQFGWENSQGIGADEILDNVRTFLEHGEAWRDGGEPLVVEFRDSAEKVPAPGSSALGDAADAEVEAWRLAHGGDWLAASQQLEAAAKLVGADGDSTRGYRGLLLYLAGVWLSNGAPSESHRARARELVRDAGKASSRGTWLGEMVELPGGEPAELERVDSVAVNAIAARLQGKFKAGAIVGELESMRDDLGQDDAIAYERGLSTLGKYLGARAFKPGGSGRCDSAWLWDNAVWLTLEAKSEQQPDGTVPLHDIRQANTQLDQLAIDEVVDAAPPGSASILITDRLTVAPEHAGTARHHVYLASTDVVFQIAGDISAVWNDLLGAGRDQTETALRAHVRTALQDHGCLPTQVLDRVMQDRIRPGD